MEKGLTKLLILLKEGISTLFDMFFQTKMMIENYESFSNLVIAPHMGTVSEKYIKAMNWELAERTSGSAIQSPFF